MKLLTTMAQVRNIKRTKAWCWQDKKVMRCIREKYSLKRKTTAIAIYESMTELASNNGTDCFAAYLSEIADLASKSISTVKRYTNEFIRFGLVKKENRKIGTGKNLSNRWSLLDISIHNSEPTSVSNSKATSDHNNQLVIEKSTIEKNYLESEGYKKAMETRKRIGLSDCIVNKSQLK